MNLKQYIFFSRYDTLFYVQVYTRKKSTSFSVIYEFVHQVSISGYILKLTRKNDNDFDCDNA